MEQKQTAVDWFATEIWKWFELKGDSALFDHLHSLAKEMEHEQIIDAYTECWMNDGGNGFHKVKEAESYYNETYGDK